MIKELYILSSIEELSGNGSQKEKQKLIAENLSDTMRYMLDICFNPFVTTKLHKLDFQETTVESFYSWSDVVELIEELKIAPAANDSLRNRANLFINCKLVDNPEEDIKIRKVLMKILTKRMNIGIGAKLINKAIREELIPDPSLMLASDDQKEIEKWGKIYCEEKYDGVRVIAKGSSKTGFTFFTRAFNELDKSKLSNIERSLIDVCKYLETTQTDLQIFFDGELTDKDRKSVSGKVTQILKGTAPDTIGDSFVFNVFDVENTSVLETRKGKSPYLKRRKILEKFFENSPEESPVKIARLWEAESMDEVNEVYKQIVSLGGEGVILKSENHVYECKRSSQWIKLKEVNDCDLLVTGWYEGEGKREGYIGGLICTDLSGTLRVKIGAGFTDQDLKTLSQDPDQLVGKIASVQYNVTITDKHGNRSLFLPRFVEIRSDKDQPDDMSKLFA
jgi:DNA ligase-1